MRDLGVCPGAFNAIFQVCVARTDKRIQEMFPKIRFPVVECLRFQQSVMCVLDDDDEWLINWVLQEFHERSLNSLFVLQTDVILPVIEGARGRIPLSLVAKSKYLQHQPKTQTELASLISASRRQLKSIWSSLRKEEPCRKSIPPDSYFDEAVVEKTVKCEAQDVKPIDLKPRIHVDGLLTLRLKSLKEEFMNDLGIAPRQNVSFVRDILGTDGGKEEKEFKRRKRISKRKRDPRFTVEENEEKRINELNKILKSRVREAKGQNQLFLGYVAPWNHTPIYMDYQTESLLLALIGFAQVETGSFHVGFTRSFSPAHRKSRRDEKSIQIRAIRNNATRNPEQFR